MDRAKAVDVEEDSNEVQFELAGEPYRCTGSIIKTLRNFEFAHSDLHEQWRAEGCAELEELLEADQLEALAENQLLGRRPRMLVGHMATGPIVGASCAFKKWLRGRDRSYLGLDMEAGGVMAALYEEIKPRRNVVLRGVSDFADERKKKLDQIGKGALRRYAMHNAVRVLWRLLDSGDLG